MRREVVKANLVVFIASFCTLVIELVAGRIMAPYVGVSLYTWTSIIGVVLAGISIGAYLGGLIADRFPRPSTLGWLLLLSGLGALSISPLTNLVRRIGIPYQLDGSDPPHDDLHLLCSLLSVGDDFSGSGEVDVKQFGEDRECGGKDLCLFNAGFDPRDLCHRILSHPMDGDPAYSVDDGDHSHHLRPYLRRLLH